MLAFDASETREQHGQDEWLVPQAQRLLTWAAQLEANITSRLPVARRTDAALTSSVREEALPFLSIRELQRWLETEIGRAAPPLREKGGPEEPGRLVYSLLSAVAHPEGPSWAAFRTGGFEEGKEWALRKGGGVTAPEHPNARTHVALAAATGMSALFALIASQDLMAFATECAAVHPDDECRRSGLFVAPPDWASGRDGVPIAMRRLGPWAHFSIPEAGQRR
jgi:hypothetical protein